MIPSSALLPYDGYRHGEEMEFSDSDKGKRKMPGKGSGGGEGKQIIQMDAVVVVIMSGC